MCAVYVCKASEVGGYSMEKNYCYLPGRGGEIRNCYSRQRERVRVRERERERKNQACEKSCFDGGRCCKFAGYSEQASPACVTASISFFFKAGVCSPDSGIVSSTLYRKLISAGCLLGHYQT